ncbi:Flp pilus assembly protein CpaB [Steroidobacter agaridevorans]|uniref:Flp pilus assembly protein CpaB n=1 Tax=Steroidobacter agaridevorans TaxID=2695856 RepID=UPI001322D46E|nr:Flp pilus assembly protein CpaB [Steroidobacter agaridevorans]GFE85693.1 Flp pilus assembly protein CpaB [Steroidobacter agaridevorans]
MMKRRGVTMVLLSLVFGAAAAWSAKNWVEQRTRASNVKDPGASVVVAAMEIPYGTALEGRHVKVISVPTGTQLGNHFNSIQEVEGLIATQKALNGEVLLKERFTKSGAGSTLAALIKPDMRAVTVRVDDVVGVAGFLLPGNRVDIVAARKVHDRATTETILMNINVLAVDQSSSQDKNEPVVVRAVTLEMTPQEAEVLVRAREEGRIQLTLRNPTDEFRPQLAATPEPPPPAPVAKPRRAPAPPRPAEPSVTIIRGTLVDNGETRT